MIQRFFIFLIAIFFNSFSSAAEPAPSFVVNVIVHVPCSFDAPATNEELLARAKALPYYIEKDLNFRYTNRVKPSRGIICPSQCMDPHDNGMPLSFAFGSFLNKLKEEAYTGALENTQAHDHIYVAALLNRMRSLDEAYNSEFSHMVDDIETDIQYRTIARLWQPQWKKEVIFSGNQTRHVTATFEEAQAYYIQLKESDPELAQAFLFVNEFQRLNSIVPYRELRELLMQSDETKALVRTSRTANPESPVYMTFMDADTLSFDLSGKGTFQAYAEAVSSSNQILHGMTTGYGASVDQGPFVAMAVSLDLSVRRALSERLSLASYFPEPNAAFRVLEEHETLEVSIPGIKSQGHHKYESPKEVPLLMGELVKKRFGESKITASPHFRFLKEGEIETQVPDRFLKNRKGKDGSSSPKKFIGKWIKERKVIAGATFQDLTNVRNTSQSHVKSRDWGGYVFAYFKELLDQTKSIRLVDGGRPGSVFSGRKDQLLTSLFSSLQSAYSPTAITLIAVKNHGYNLLEYLFDLLRNFEERTPTALSITYGNTGAQGTKRVGKVLQDYVKTYETFGIIVDKFFTRPVFSQVQLTAQLCGRAEIPVLTRFLQGIIIIPVPFKLPEPKVKVERAVKLLPPAMRAPKEEIRPEGRFQYPTAHITFGSIKQLMSSLGLYKSYKDLDTFLNLPQGNSWRIVNKAKLLSPNVRAVWQAFKGKSWTDVIISLSLSDTEMASITHSSEENIRREKDRNKLFLDTFFYLQENNQRANAA